jgi:hypothetical protein
LDDGSVDPDGESITVSLSPAGPYAAGPTAVTLIGCDPTGACGACEGTITVNLPLERTSNVMRFLDAKLGQDFLRVHGRIEPCAPLDPSSTAFEVELRNADEVIYHASLPAGAIQKKGRRRWQYADRSANLTHDGIRDVRITYSPRRQRYDLRLHAFQGMSLATTPDMTLTMRFGSQPYAVMRTWTAKDYGWQLRIQ